MSSSVTRGTRQEYSLEDGLRL